MLECACGVMYRNQTAACEEMTCSSADYLSKSSLSARLGARQSKLEDYRCGRKF